MSLPQLFNWTTDKIGDGIRAVGNVAGDALKWTGNKIKDVVDSGADSVRAILKDPIPTLLRYGAMAIGASVGIPPYVTSAATDSMTERFNLPLDTAMQVAKVSNAALTSSLVGGINAAITGKSVAQGISSGFTSGIVYAGTESYFDLENKGGTGIEVLFQKQN